MKRRLVVAGALGTPAMVVGVLFPLLMVLFTPVKTGGLGAPMTAAPNILVMASALLLLPGVIGLYLVHAATFDRKSMAAVAALAGGLVLVFATAFIETTTGAISGVETLWMVIAGLLVIGSVGTGLATAGGNLLTHGRAGGIVLAVSVVALFGVVPVLSALSVVEAVPATLVGLLATGPMGLAWLILGYDLLTLENVSIHPTRILPAER